MHSRGGPLGPDHATLPRNRLRLRRALNIIKMRTSNHDMGVFEYVIDKHGVTIKDRLEGVRGVLEWSALRSKS